MIRDLKASTLVFSPATAGVALLSIVAAFSTATALATEIAATPPSADSGSPADSADLSSLEDQLNALNVPINQAPVSVTEEKLYSVQGRYAPLRFKHELSAGGARNFTTDSFVDSSQLNAGYRFHFSDRWSLGLSGSYVFNKYSESGERLLRNEGVLPDTAYVKYRGDLTVGLNLFYGKFRVTMDRVFYFDQYWTLGPALIEMDTGRSYGAVVDAGLVLWLGRRGSVRVGLKDYVYNEKRVLSSGVAHDLTGHVEFGVMLGGGA